MMFENLLEGKIRETIAAEIGNFAKDVATRANTAGPDTVFLAQFATELERLEVWLNPKPPATVG